MNKKASEKGSAFSGHFFPKGKKAMELSINFLVIVILSIVMLSSGILLIKKYFSTAYDIKEQLDSQTMAQIEELLSSGTLPVVMPLASKTMEAGSSAVFGLGVLNVNPAKTPFNVEISLSKLVRKDKSEDTSEETKANAESWLMYEDSFYLEYRQDVKIPVKADVPKQSQPGTYIFDVEVDSNGQQYGISKMYITVP